MRRTLILCVLFGVTVGFAIGVVARAVDGEPRRQIEASAMGPLAKSEATVPVVVTAPETVVPAQEAVEMPPVEQSAMAREPVVTPTEAPAVPSVPAPAPATPVTVCEVTHAGNDNASVWGVYGKTDLPNGTEFTFTLTVDGIATSYPLVARTASAIIINGQTIGYGGYTPQTGVFGFTQADIPHVDHPYTSAAVKVSYGGATICEG